MTEEEARAWISDTFGVPRGTIVSRYAEILRRESSKQNLISASTIPEIWTRHLLDSAQLIPLTEDAPPGVWLDVGSGAGLPGIVAAALLDRPVVLVEPRAKRVEFLRDTAAELELRNVVVVQGKVESYHASDPVAVVSARAVAELSSLLGAAYHCANSSTIWVLPKGRNAQSEVAAARRTWQGSFHVEPSMTQPESGIVVANGVRPK
ncbi:16S rRNA (guanine(527)-N(7))-methyltransferase RsmG [Sphingomonas sp. S2-65]|uniref:16S rRNA (guanine(527)-N(7))-methyltransferase RsmG n=1 Tax=Sphingomonas sp. S2-65 TaxID=2903960 RepID=UPI001F25A2B8|nr:16S rRNA (guanine(527)-N(7))-methyltransferase RsmG [Sphingomonas sp. S2-65]UYY57320.1 16S rRNA (guanine(527)-N(7))-methyltransferase RsmG [Sphingomonas sp. S2-65]